MTIIRIGSPVAERPSLTGGSSSRGTHQLLAAASCERQYAFRYVTRQRPQGEPTFRLVGTLVHSALAYHYASQMKKPPKWFEKLQARGLGVEQVLEAEGEGYPEVVENALATFEAYKARWAGDPVVPLFVEEEFSATLGELDPAPDRPWPGLDDEVVTCRVDLVGLLNGLPWIIDHKCTGGEWQRDRLPRFPDQGGEYRLNLQILMNLHILRLRLPELGYEAPQGFLINRIKRKMPFDFDRNPASPTKLAYDEAPRQIRGLVYKELDIRARMKAGIKPVAGYNCYGRYGACDYIEICAASSAERRKLVMATGFTSPR